MDAENCLGKIKKERKNFKLTGGRLKGERSTKGFDFDCKAKLGKRF